MLIDSLRTLRARIVLDFCAAMEFKAFTSLAYMFAREHTANLHPTSPYQLGYSDYAAFMGLSDNTVLACDLPKHLASAQDKYLLSLVHQHQVSLFEYLFFDLLRLLLCDQPLHLSGNKQVDYATIFKADSKEEIIWSLVDREINELKYKNVSEWFHYLQKLIAVAKVAKQIRI